MDHMIAFANKVGIKGATIKPKEEPGRSPFLIVDVAAHAGSNGPAPDYCVLMYGHMDKQPFGEGWLTDPCDPVIKDGKLYGRGSVDDGYAFFSACLCIKACQDLGLKHPRVVITIEGSEEGEIDDLKFYLKKFNEELGNPDLVFCLDAGGDSKETMTITTTLRGCLNFDLKVTVGEDNLHSGLGGGMMPQPF